MVGQDIRAGKAFVELGLRNKLGKQLRSAGAKMAAFGGILAGPLVGAIKLFASAGDTIHKMSIRSGLSAQALTELGHAAELSGTDLKQVGDGVIRMRRRIANAATATGPAARAMKELGLNAAEVTKLPVEEQFNIIIDAMGKMENQSRANQMAFEIFGDSSKAMLPLLHSGAAGIAAMRKEARDLGVTMADEDAQAAADLTDMLARLKAMGKGLLLTIGSTLAPVFIDLAERLQNTIGPFIEFMRANAGVVKTILGVAAAIVGLGGVLTTAGIALGAMHAGFAAIISVLGAIFSPLGLVIGAVAALGYAILFHTDAGAAALDWLGKQFKRLMDFVGPIVAGIKDALSAGDFRLAAKIAWLGIKVAFQNGKNWVMQIWREFTTGIVQMFDDAAQKIAAKWRSMQSKIAEVLIAASEKLGLLGGLSAADVIQTLREDTARAQRGADSRARDRATARGAALQAAAAADEAAIKELQEQLGRNLKKARVAAAEAEMREAQKREPPPPPETPEIPRLEAAGAVVGTFSAAVAGMLGRASNAPERTARATEDMRATLRAMRQHQEQGEDAVRFKP
jgi:uncharacterized Tic20 family protein